MVKSKRKKSPSDLTDKDYERLGKMMASIGEMGFRDKKQLYKMSFLKGIVGGFGGVIGATIIVALLLLLLSTLGSVPLIGDIAESIRTTIDSSQ